MSAPVRCRFVASWSEAEPIPGRGPELDDVVAEASVASDAARPFRYHKYRTADADLAAILRAAHAAGLPTRFDPAHVACPERIPLLVDHRGEVVGEAFRIEPDGRNGFTVEGYADQRFYDLLAALPYLSPGVTVDAATIIDGELFVTASTLVEVSAVEHPGRSGTRFAIERPAVVPERMLFALEAAGPFRVDGFPSTAIAG